jgi:hypothetical protein
MGASLREPIVIDLVIVANNSGKELLKMEEPRRLSGSNYAMEKGEAGVG